MSQLCTWILCVGIKEWAEFVENELCQAKLRLTHGGKLLGLCRLSLGVALLENSPVAVLGCLETRRVLSAPCWVGF